MSEPNQIPPRDPSFSDDEDEGSQAPPLARGAWLCRMLATKPTPKNGKELDYAEKMLQREMEIKFQQELKVIQVSSSISSVVDRSVLEDIPYSIFLEE